MMFVLYMYATFHCAAYPYVLVIAIPFFLIQHVTFKQTLAFDYETSMNNRNINITKIIRSFITFSIIFIQWGNY